MFVKNSDREYKDLGGGVRRKVLAYSDNIMNVELLFEKGAKGEMHSHPHGTVPHTATSSHRSIWKAVS